jgi:nitrate/nitrite transporter NarK
LNAGAILLLDSGSRSAVWEQSDVLISDIVGVVLGVLVAAGALGAFFLSLFRLQRQMVDVKAAELAIARDLYAEAYEPVREARTWRRSTASAEC